MSRYRYLWKRREGDEGRGEERRYIFGLLLQCLPGFAAFSDPSVAATLPSLDCSFTVGGLPCLAGLLSSDFLQGQSGFFSPLGPSLDFSLDFSFTVSHTSPAISAPSSAASLDFLHLSLACLPPSSLAYSKVLTGPCPW